MAGIDFTSNALKKFVGKRDHIAFQKVSLGELQFSEVHLLKAKMAGIHFTSNVHTKLFLVHLPFWHSKGGPENCKFIMRPFKGFASLAHKRSHNAKMDGVAEKVLHRLLI